jgi:hypothetical protein
MAHRHDFIKIESIEGIPEVKAEISEEDIARWEEYLQAEADAVRVDDMQNATGTSKDFTEEFLSLPDDVLEDLSASWTDADWRKVQCIFAEGGFFSDSNANFRPFTRMVKKLQRGRWIYSIYISLGKLLHNINLGRSQLGLPDIPSLQYGDRDVRTWRVEFDSEGNIYHRIKAVQDWAKGLYHDFPCYFEEFLKNGYL